jgi:hypothetical protein
MPPLEGLPSSFIAERGTEEYVELTARVEAGELSRAVVKDDEVSGRIPQREVFCPTDFDIAYIGAAALKYQGILGLEWIGDAYYDPNTCRTASLDAYVQDYISKKEANSSDTYESGVPVILPSEAGIVFGVKPSEEFTPFGAGVIFISEKQPTNDGATDTDNRPITEIE